jgi:hypothetical protein
MSFFTKPYLSRVVLSVALIGVTAPAYAAAPAGEANAEEVMARAKTQAAAEHKNILLSFSASWCGNCRLFDAFLADPKIRPILDKAFVFADLDTGERPDDKRHANIPGGREIMDALGGKTAGYPYLVMVDPRGEPIADSRRPANLAHPGNIGYPDAAWEIDWFMEMLKKAAPSLSSRETATLRSWLTAHSSSQH